MLEQKGWYMKADWIPSALTLITLESAGILVTTVIMVVFKAHSNATVKT